MQSIRDECWGTSTCLDDRDKQLAASKENQCLPHVTHVLASDTRRGRVCGATSRPSMLCIRGRRYWVVYMEEMLLTSCLLRASPPHFPYLLTKPRLLSKQNQSF